jgi:hypothetical protein
MFGCQKLKYFETVNLITNFRVKTGQFSRKIEVEPCPIETQVRKYDFFRIIWLIVSSKNMTSTQHFFQPFVGKRSVSIREI